LEKRTVFVEDTYGVQFHRYIVDRLIETGVVQGNYQPQIRRMPAKKCNHALYRKILGALLLYRSWRAIIIIDSEGKPSNEAAENDVLSHFERYRDRVRVVVVEPRHEAWLCIGLGGEPLKCRRSPEDQLSMLLRRPYSKHLLATMSRHVGLERLISERDFREYIEALKWLMT